MPNYLGLIEANALVYDHFIDTATDETYVVAGGDTYGKRLFSVDSSLNVTDVDGKSIGAFSLGGDNWGFVSTDGSQQVWTQHTINEAEGLLFAERVVFKQMLEAACRSSLTSSSQP